MSASAPEATENYSTRDRPSRGRRETFTRARTALTGLSIVAGIMLVVSTFMTLIRVTNGQEVLGTQSGLSHHSVAMLLLGVAAVPMALGALRGARPAMLALAVLGVVVLVVAFTVDLPAAQEEGLFGERYEGAEAGPGAGFYVETLAGALLILSGGLHLMLRGDGGGGSNRRGERRERRERPARRERPTADDLAAPPPSDAD